MRRLLVTAVTAALLGAVPASAAAQPEHVEPQGPAKVAFPADFPTLVDHEWGFPLGGFGGVSRGGARKHVPVIFVHGNTVDAADWYPVRDAFRAAGWTDQELWALSYNGLGANTGTALLTANPEAEDEHRAMGWDGQARVTSNEVNVADLHDFIGAVRTYTGSSRFTLVTHSLGVTLARRTLKVHPELRDDLVAFVGIAGGNHGTSLCPPGSEGLFVSCDEVAAGSAWLADLNGPAGADETYGPASWLTIYDGSGAADPAYAGPGFAESPRLEGADNRAFPGTYHNDLRLSPAIVAEYRTFIEAAESAVAAPESPSAPVPPSPPPAGSGTGAGAFSSPGGFVAPSAPAGPVGSLPSPPTAESDGGSGAADVEQVATVATTRVSTIGRHWSGAANGAMVLLLALGVALLVLDRRRRRANQEVVA